MPAFHKKSHRLIYADLIVRKEGKGRNTGVIEKIYSVLCCNYNLFMNQTSLVLKSVIVRVCRQGAALIAFLPQETKHQDRNARNIS